MHGIGYVGEGTKGDGSVFLNRHDGEVLLLAEAQAEGAENVAPDEKIA